VTTALKPPFTYFGGKTRIAEKVAALLPAHEHYVEPFAGSLAVLLAKPRSMMETVSDLDGSLVAFWRVLRDRPAELERACALTPHSRAEHAQAIAVDEATDDLERARRVWVRLTQGRSGQLHHLTGWRHYQDARGSRTTMPDYLAAYAGRIAPAAERLAGVSLECLPALEVIARYGRHAGVLLYADPPYLESSRQSAGRGPSYLHELRTEAEHRELAEALRSCSATVVLSGYDSPLYTGLYGDWHQAEIAGYTGNGHEGSAARTEVLWSNKPFPQATLFDLEVPCPSLT
jgi:DNA adenine methylase